MDAVENVSGAGDFVHMTPTGLALLRAEGFDFTSRSGAILLEVANLNPQVSDDRVIALIDAGAPVRDLQDPDDDLELMTDAIELDRRPVIDALLAKGALLKDGTPDQAAIDSAFDTAISSGHMEVVLKFWPYHPSLTFEDKTLPPQRDGTATRVPVTLLLDASVPGSPEWDGLSIARFLLDQGCDINAATGESWTLLHIAARSHNPRLVRYLLDHGARIDTANAIGKTPLDVAFDDTIAIMLLEAGADPLHASMDGTTFAEHAQSGNRKAVLAWLAAHGVALPAPDAADGDEARQ
jgi:ankyrin repeat protein